MDLKQNLIDNILECEVKLGPMEMSMTFYYPQSSLCELLDTTDSMLLEAIEKFCVEVKDTLGPVKIAELPSEKGRFGIKIPKEGVKWVSSNYTASQFVIDFISKIQTRGIHIEDIIMLFKSFDANVVIIDDHETCDDHDERAVALMFDNDSIDPYVYKIEENAFGLEYHRYTKKAYLKGE